MQRCTLLSPGVGLWSGSETCAPMHVFIWARRSSCRGAGQLGTGDISKGKTWHNRSVPIMPRGLKVRSHFSRCHFCCLACTFPLCPRA